MTETCIFCSRKLDNSDEHIIPQSINGRIHNKRLICQKCNHDFGTNVDPIIKETFGLLLHVLKIGNNSKAVVENESGKKFLFDSTTGKIEQVAPEIREEILPDGRIALNVSGPDSLKTYKTLATKAVRRFGRNALKGKYSVVKTTEINESYSTKFELNVTPQLLLALQKIMVEFYCHNGLDRTNISELLNTVWKLEFNNTKVTICNTKHEIRAPHHDEISHLLVIRNNRDQKKLYGYIELFNVVCGYIIFSGNYDGPDLDLVYHQDAITGELVDKPIELNISGIEAGENDFQKNVIALFERLQVRDIDRKLHEIINEIKASLDKQLSEGTIDANEHKKIFLEEATKAAAMLSVHHFEIFEDFTDEELRAIHYGNSIIREDRKEGFAFFYQKFVGHEFTFEDEEGLFTMQEFVYTKCAPRGNVALLKVYCKFVSQNNGSVRFYPASNIFKIVGVPYLPEEFTWNW